MKSIRPLITAALAALITLALMALTLPPLTRAAAAQDSQNEMSYDENLALLRASSVRNANHDASPWRDTPMDQLAIENHLGPRSDYLNNPGGNPEHAFPTAQGGQFRTACEFSHFGYDDPVVHPGEPGAAHLHMFWGNTDVNAMSTADTLLNSGSSTCNGQELNRTGYWAPAMFDGAGNVRIPERIVVYYKGEGLANGASQVYPPGAAMIPSIDINTVSSSQGGAEGKSSYKCSDQWSGAEDPQANTIPSCDGSRFFDEYGVIDNPHVVLEMNVKFPQCWNGQDAANPDNYSIPQEGGWYYSLCPAGFTTLPNLEYFINYRVEIGENTADWYLSSDIDPETFGLRTEPGTSIHADWWGAWKPEVNQMWLDNCVNFSLANADTGCGFGYLTNGGPDGDAPFDGPALRYRPHYDGPSSVPAETLFAELCPTDRVLGAASEAAYCHPGDHHHGNEEPDPIPGAEITPAPEPTAPAGPVRLCRGQAATIVGTIGDDVLVGTDGRDIIWSGGGRDQIEARGGDDLVCSGSGDDVVDGGDGDDEIHAGSGYDNVWGGPGNDDLRGGGDDDWMFGQDGDDRLRGGSGADELHGEFGDDQLFGNQGDDTLIARYGIDDLHGGPGTDDCQRVATDPSGDDTRLNRSCEFASELEAWD